MEQFEKQFEDMDVRSGYMETAMESTTAMATPPEEVDALIQVREKEAKKRCESMHVSPHAYLSL